MNQRGPAEQVEVSELTERAAGMLDSALAIGDSQGISDAVDNLADALIKQAEADGSGGTIAAERTGGHGRRGQERCPGPMHEPHADHPASPAAR